MEKDQEVERQVADLVEKKLVVPGDGARSSPVVRVRTSRGGCALITGS